jgi:mannose-6-phosphate isomerase-like protein (cupin superfamily)
MPKRSSANDREVKVMARRVVTGHNDAGKAVFASDEELVLQNGVTGVWGADFEDLQYPDDGSKPDHEDELFPKVGGFRYVIVTLPPEGAETSSAEAGQQQSSAPPARQNYQGDFPEGPGFHRTATVDLEVVLSGEVTLELDDGVTRTMKPGDTIIQSGTKHRWHNRGSVPASFAAIIIGVGHDEFQ